MGFADKAKKILQDLKEKNSFAPKPYFYPDGDLVIPFNSDPKYHWWDGGQSIEATINEIKKEA